MYDLNFSLSLSLLLSLLSLSAPLSLTRRFAYLDFRSQLPPRVAEHLLHWLGVPRREDHTRLALVLALVEPADDDLRLDLLQLLERIISEILDGAEMA